MRTKLKKLADQVIVVTGASSGIGLATARMAAERGARVVLTSRNEAVLTTVAMQLNGAGCETIHVVADVGCREDVERIAETAIARFGRIDTWVNNAGVAIWGRVQDGDDEDSRRLFDTNFWGTVYGSIVAARYLRESGGALINIGSVSTELSEPLQALYAASKHAVKGFTDAFRMELEQDGAPISVTLVKPASIGTPLPQHVKNDTGLEAVLPAPIYAPEEVARTILYAATHPVRDQLVGTSSRMVTALARRAPRVRNLFGERFMGPARVRKAPVRHHRNNLHEAGIDGQVRGEDQGRWMLPSFGARWRQIRPRMSTLALLTFAGLAAASLFRARLQA